MDQIEARTLIRRLLESNITAAASPRLLTALERQALEVASQALDTAGRLPNEQTPTVPPGRSPAAQPSNPTKAILDASVLDLPAADASSQVCIDFGTAMSKAVLTRSLHGNERPFVLPLGKPGEQMHISEYMLVSSVYIANDGLLYFGQSAVDAHLAEDQLQERDRIDDIKRFLSEGQFDEPLQPSFNPTNEAVTARDVVLLYLAFLTWAVNTCVGELGVPRNVNRRYAIPCLEGSRKKQVTNVMSDLLGKAQILADTVGDRFREPISLFEMMALVREVDRMPSNFPFVACEVAEPVAVAASFPNGDRHFRSVFVVIDVGAGTIDFGLFRIAVALKAIESRCPPESLRVLREAGNYLDRCLLEIMMLKSGLQRGASDYARVRALLRHEMRSLKETLFNEGSVTPFLADGPAIGVELREFLDTKPVQGFTQRVVETLQSILDDVDTSWLGDHNHRIGILITGGGAELPMLTALRSARMTTRGITVQCVPVRALPEWLASEHPDIAEAYPRIAVALGGARSFAVNLRQASTTAREI